MKIKSLLFVALLVPNLAFADATIWKVAKFGFKKVISIPMLVGSAAVDAFEACKAEDCTNDMSAGKGWEMTKHIADSQWEETKETFNDGKEIVEELSD